jgi:hypothetical protein
MMFHNTFSSIVIPIDVGANFVPSDAPQHHRHIPMQRERLSSAILLSATHPLIQKILNTPTRSKMIRGAVR